MSVDINLRLSPGLMNDFHRNYAFSMKFQSKLKSLISARLFRIRKNSQVTRSLSYHFSYLNIFSIIIKDVVEVEVVEE